MISSVEAGKKNEKKKKDQKDQKDKKDDKQSLGSTIKNMVGNCVNCQKEPKAKKDSSFSYDKESYDANFDNGNYGQC